MFKLSDTRKPFVLLTITLMIMFIIPNLAVAGGHGGMGMGGMGMGGMGMGGMGMGGMGGGYYSGYYPSTTTASLLGRYTPYATTIGSPYSAYGYSPYSTRLGSLLGSPLGGYGLGLGGYYSGLGAYGGGLYAGGYGGGLYAGGYGGGIVTGKTYGTEQTYTTYVPGGEIGTTVSEYTDVAYPYSYGLLGGGLGAYGLGGGLGYNPYSYGLVGGIGGWV